MKYLKQLLVILAFSLLGECLSRWIPFPVPGAIYGFLLLFLALCTGLLKEQHINDTADFLVALMPVFFVSPAVNLLASFDLIAKNLVPIVTIMVVSTFLVFAVAGLVTKWLRRRDEDV
jgi:holin-like protein